MSQTLPTTSYVKMVEIWLIFNLFIPFSEVLLHTYMDYLRFFFLFLSSGFNTYQMPIEMMKAEKLTTMAKRKQRPQQPIMMLLTLSFLLYKNQKSYSHLLR